jgi:hypothetical protein
MPNQPQFTGLGETNLLISSGTATLGTAAIASGASSLVTVSAPGVLSSDNLLADFGSDPSSTTGYIPGAMLSIIKYITTDNVNFLVCNNTALSITPAQITLNWKVLRATGGAGLPRGVAPAKQRIRSRSRLNTSTRNVVQKIRLFFK